VIEPYNETKKFKAQNISPYSLLNFVAQRRKEEPPILNIV
jgi:hypothetical protein